MIKCENPKCGKTIEGTLRGQVCRGCGFIMHTVPCVEDNAFEQIDETYISENPARMYKAGKKKKEVDDVS